MHLSLHVLNIRIAMTMIVIRETYTEAAAETVEFILIVTLISFTNRSLTFVLKESMSTLSVRFK